MHETQNITNGSDTYEMISINSACWNSGKILLTFLLMLTDISIQSAVAADRVISENPETQSRLSRLNTQPKISLRQRLLVSQKNNNVADLETVSISDGFSANVKPKIFNEKQQAASLKTNNFFKKQQNASLTESANTQTRKAIFVSQVNSSNLSPAQQLMISPNQGDRQILSQTATPSAGSETPLNDSELRQNLKIKPLLGSAGVKQTYPPSLSFGIPSAFGANMGDFFFAASAANRKEANGDAGFDGSTSVGFGLGDSQKLIGLEVSFNNGSIKNFGANGTFDLKAHRVLYAGSKNQVAAAVGWNTFAQYGNEAIADSTVYGAVTNVSVLQPNNPNNKMPLALTVGVGGGNFRPGNDSVGVFGGFGLQVHPQVGVGASWSGVGLNAGVSFVPVPTIPLTIVLQGSDLTDRTPGGTAFIISIGYGFNFLPK
ncbi:MULTISPECIES: hypothetical protein [unclassified Nostoc]|uniref:hypothetical protein n=1 Tax=unclassified Nostoc TaxID=2593658 RepID=UPI001E038521|nr:hypothetical protein [Nostoc sp. JL23]MBN3875797.1 hypothetical protein [Nostoc sp. JL23]